LGSVGALYIRTGPFNLRHSQMICSAKSLSPISFLRFLTNSILFLTVVNSSAKMWTSLSLKHLALKSRRNCDFIRFEHISLGMYILLLEPLLLQKNIHHHILIPRNFNCTEFFLIVLVSLVCSLLPIVWLGRLAPAVVGV